MPGCRPPPPPHPHPIRPWLEMLSFERHPTLQLPLTPLGLTAVARHAAPAVSTLQPAETARRRRRRSLIYSQIAAAVVGGRGGGGGGDGEGERC